MASQLLTVAIFLVTLVALAWSQPTLPKLLDPDVPNLRRVHILSEINDSVDGYRLAEELIDLDSGKAAYMETRNGVRTSWLIDVDENSMHKYLPFSCEQSTLDLVTIEQPPIFDTLSGPKIRTSSQQNMYLYGISAILKTFSESLLSNYKGTVNEGNKVLHTFSLSIDSNFRRTMKLFYSQGTTATGGNLQLDSLEIWSGSQKTTIKIMSVSHDISHEDQKKLDLPLIYGCTRRKIYSEDLRRSLNIISADQSKRYLLKARARAINFIGANPTSTEDSNVEIATSDPRDGTHGKLLSIRHQNSQSNSKMLVDSGRGLKLEADLSTRKCEISRIRSTSDSRPVMLRFSDELTLRLEIETLESMLYGVKPESYIKVEQSQRDQSQHFYFAQEFSGAFGAGKAARVVRRFSFDTNGRSKLDSFTIWVFAVNQDSPWTIQSVFEFNIVTSTALISDSDNAQAFDMSQECYIDNEEMIYGRDYVWAALTYQTNLAHELQSRVAELKSAFYHRIGSNMKLNYLRVPRMEITFSESSFTLKMLVLDSLAPHMVYDQVDSHTLDPLDVRTSVSVGSIRECSDLCKQHKCTAMSFSSALNTCSIAIQQFQPLKPCDGSVSYSSGTTDLDLISLTELGLDERASNSQHSSQNLGGIVGLDDFNQSLTMGGSNQFSNLRLTYQFDGRSLELTPTRLQVESNH